MLSRRTPSSTDFQRRTLLSAMAAVLSVVAPATSLAAAHDEEAVKADAKVDVRVAPPKPAVKVVVKKAPVTGKIEKAKPHDVEPKGKTVVKHIDGDAKPERPKVKAEAHAVEKVTEKAHVTAKVAERPAVKVVEKTHATGKVEAHAAAKVVSEKSHLQEHATVPGKVAAHEKREGKTKVAVVDPHHAKGIAGVPVAEKPLEKADKPPSPLKRTKMTAARMPTTVSGRKKAASKGAGVEAPAKPCHAAQVHVDRGGLEASNLPLVDCKGKPLASAQEKLSVLVRPWGAARPTSVAHTPNGVIPKADPKGEIAPGVRLLDQGLLVRLDAISKRFPGKGFSFVSGYRPQSRGSLHQSGRAVDVRVNGVSNEELVAFCKTLKDTGCGYYPNSSFVHVDVRNTGTGSTSWIDASGPGEAPHYVSAWPPPKHIAGAGEAKEEIVPAPADEEPHDDVPSEDLPRKKNLGEYPDRL